MAPDAPALDTDRPVPRRPSSVSVASVGAVLPSPANTRRLSREQTYYVTDDYPVPATVPVPVPVRPADFDTPALSLAHMVQLQARASSASLRDSVPMPSSPTAPGNMPTPNNNGSHSRRTSGVHPAIAAFMPPVPSSPRMSPSTSVNNATSNITHSPTQQLHVSPPPPLPADAAAAVAAINALSSRFESVFRDMQEKMDAQGDLLERMFAYVVKIDKENEGISDEVALLRQQMSALKGGTLPAAHSSPSVSDVSPAAEVSVSATNAVVVVERIP
ncbi:hypothetical protein HDU83_007409 [Entophlyctis luteolus]|nr:hypothetical protein HDU83_007409 [Entophlyctis luteolus]